MDDWKQLFKTPKDEEVVLLLEMFCLPTKAAQSNARECMLISGRGGIIESIDNAKLD
jgi:hypothetical protein